MAATDYLQPAQFHEATGVAPPSIYKQAKAKAYKAAIVATPILAKAAMAAPHAHGMHLQ